MRHSRASRGARPGERGRAAVLRGGFLGVGRGVVRRLVEPAAQGVQAAVPELAVRVQPGVECGDRGGSRAWTRRRASCRTRTRPASLSTFRCRAATRWRDEVQR
ncbi:hypothetical protein STVIR_0331 [Streptomyces viridochromogenes Tue57]|uniref:Uncharacterized protein n=1 Tax=Streptomyces viridochromogenes Tue57 TaxID=1160705 RepID=L8PRH4_STRVR|nr:hypothetical protein STVIR_0331 [Streptomyces viridochromogenes Tue57]